VGGSAAFGGAGVGAGVGAAAFGSTGSRRGGVMSSGGSGFNSSGGTAAGCGTAVIACRSTRVGAALGSNCLVTLGGNVGKSGFVSAGSIGVGATSGATSVAVTGFTVSRVRIVTVARSVAAGGVGVGVGVGSGGGATLISGDGVVVGARSRRALN
jgi:hypothetical protein